MSSIIKILVRAHALFQVLIDMYFRPTSRSMPEGQTTTGASVKPRTSGRFVCPQCDKSFLRSFYHAKVGRDNSAHTSVFPNGKLLFSDSEEYFQQSIAGS